MGTQIGLFIIIAFILVILLNYHCARFLIKKALRKLIKPSLSTAGFTYVDAKWPGFFNRGNFKDDRMKIVPGFSLGQPQIDLYASVFYEGASELKTVTVKTETIVLFIKRVSYSQNI